MVCKNKCGTVEKRDRMRGGKGTAEIEKLFDKLPQNCRLAGVITLNKGTGIGEHEHTDEGELFYVLSGAAIYYDNGVPTMLETGDSALVYNGKHAVEGVSDEPCRLLAVIITG